jgi:subtilase family serine protease
MRDRIARRVGVAAIGVVVITAMALPAFAGGSSRVAVRGSVPAWATPKNLHGVANARGTMDIHVLLGWRDTKGLAAYVRSVTNPKSSGYGHYLSAAAFHAAYSPSKASAAKVASWLRSQGLKVTAGPASRLWVAATGSVAAVQKAFGTKINVYRSHGELLRAPASAPTVPASLKSIVKGVTGISDLFAHTNDPAPPPGAFVVAQPCSAYWAEKMATNKPPAYGQIQPYTPCGYSPQQIQGAYGITGAIKSGNDGSGVTVAVIDAFYNPTLVPDLKQYSKNHDLPAPDISLKKFPPYTADDARQQGWYGEQALDVDAVHGMAPGAHILYVGAKSNSNTALDHAMAYVLDNEAADETTNSYGFLGENVPGSVIQEEEALFAQAAAEGIGTYFSSGDSGDEIGNLGYRSTDYPASSPNVTAVGGTSLGVDANNSYRLETGWGTSVSNLSHGDWDPAPPGNYFYGGGGGTSRIFAEPWYQVPVVPESLSGYFGGEGRVVPDIALDGDPNTGYLLGITQTFPDGSVKYGEQRIGGTSLSSPLLAGIMALAQQRAGHPLGFINPALYQNYQDDPSIVRDVVDPSITIAVVRTNFVNGVDNSDGKAFSVRTMNTTGTLHTIPGYDDVTGIGTVNGETYLDSFGG